MILIAIGSSLPFCGSAPQETVARAIRAIGQIGPVAAVSRFYESPAWPDASDPAFINAAIALGDAPPAPELMAVLHAVEAAFGRRRDRRNAPRTLDLDLIAYRQLVVDESAGGGLVLPHPGIAARDFVLAPLFDIAPDWVHPVTGRTVREMLGRLDVVTAIPLQPDPPHFGAAAVVFPL
jgi:2-amino-4-hydroxy-6-hydroxymethyldihydropteridine diphosphokinase